MASGGSVKVYNSIVSGNGGEQIDAFSRPYNRKTRAEVAYSCIEGGVQQVNVAVLNTGTRNISADPRFVDPGKGDYRLAADSPCIDAGKNSYSASPTDLDGKARIANGKVDIGCHEYSPAR